MSVWDMMQSISEYKPKFNSFFKDVNSDFIDERVKVPPSVHRYKIDDHYIRIYPNGDLKWEIDGEILEESELSGLSKLFARYDKIKLKSKLDKKKTLLSN